MSSTRIHEIVAKVLDKIEQGTWIYAHDIDDALVHALLANHMKNRLKKRRRGAEHDAEHLRAGSSSNPHGSRLEHASIPVANPTAKARLSTMKLPVVSTPQSIWD